MKPECHNNAASVFSGTGVQLSTEGSDLSCKNGHCHLGAAAELPEFISDYLTEKVTAWTTQVNWLTEIAQTDPHAAYAAFAFRLRHRWNFIQRTILTSSEHMEPLRDATRNCLIPTLTKHEFNDMEMELVSLPARYGGMTFDDPVADSSRKHDDSLKCTAMFTNLLLNNESELPETADFDHEATIKVKRNCRAMLISKPDEIQSNLPEPQCV